MNPHSVGAEIRMADTNGEKMMNGTSDVSLDADDFVTQCSKTNTCSTSYAQNNKESNTAAIVPKSRVDSETNNKSADNNTDSQLDCAKSNSCENTGSCSTAKIDSHKLSTDLNSSQLDKDVSSVESNDSVSVLTEGNTTFNSSLPSSTAADLSVNTSPAVIGSAVHEGRAAAAAGNLDGTIATAGGAAAGLMNSNGADAAHFYRAMTDEQKHVQLRSQLEYYFSFENLSRDTYMKSQMDDDQYIKVEVVAQFKLVQQLTSSLELVTETLREIPGIQVDCSGDTPRARRVNKRSTLILREVPKTTPIEDVKALFVGEGCPHAVAVEFAHNDNWYVSFENESDAQTAYRFLREVVQTFLGKPIMARIKMSPPLTATSFPPVPRPPQQFVGLPIPPTAMEFPAAATVGVPSSQSGVMSPAAGSFYPFPFSSSHSQQQQPAADNSAVTSSEGSQSETSSVTAAAVDSSSAAAAASFNSVSTSNAPAPFISTSSAQQNFPFFPPAQILSSLMNNPCLMDPNIINVYAMHMAAATGGQIHPSAVAAAAVAASVSRFAQGNAGGNVGGGFSGPGNQHGPYGNNRTSRRPTRPGDMPSVNSGFSKFGGGGYNNTQRRAPLSDAANRQAASAPRFARMHGTNHFTNNSGTSSAINSSASGSTVSDSTTTTAPSVNTTDTSRQSNDTHTENKYSSNQRSSTYSNSSSNQDSRYNRSSTNRTSPSGRGAGSTYRKYGDGAMRNGSSGTGASYNRDNNRDNRYDRDSRDTRDNRDRRGGGYGPRSGGSESGRGGRRTTDPNTRVSESERRTREERNSADADSSFHLEANAFPPLPAAAAAADSTSSTAASADSTAVTSPCSTTEVHSTQSTSHTATASMFRPWCPAFTNKTDVLRLDDKMSDAAKDSHWPLSSANQSRGAKPLTNGMLGLSGILGSEAEKKAPVTNGGFFGDIVHDNEHSVSTHNGRISADSMASMSFKMNRSTSMENLAAEIASLTADDADDDLDNHRTTTSKDTSSRPVLSYAQMAQRQKEAVQQSEPAAAAVEKTAAVDKTSASVDKASAVTDKTADKFSAGRQNGTRYSKMRASSYARKNDSYLSNGNKSEWKENVSNGDLEEREEEGEGWQVVGKTEGHRYNNNGVLRGKYPRRNNTAVVREGFAEAAE